MRGEKGTRVLIAEDDYLVRRAIARTLGETEYLVVGHAADGRKAVEMAESLRPDVVLMDIQMPDMGGIEATRLIHERCPTPVVVMTAHESSELVEAAGKAGVGAYLVKPPRAGEMERAIAIAVARFDDMIELRRLNAELEASNADLQAFAHTVAHDLKSPLSVILGFSELLGSNSAQMPLEHTAKSLDHIVKMGRKMSDIIDALLLFASVRQADEVEREQLDMGTVVGQVLARLASDIEVAHAEIVAPETWPTVCSQASWIEEVWVNYISNALKYGGDVEDGVAPCVELGVCDAEDGAGYRFFVRDNGPGLAPEKRAKVFTPFTRFHRARAEGHGLGLSIVQRIVEKLGGQVGVDSAGAGQGSTFWFVLPSTT